MKHKEAKGESFGGRKRLALIEGQKETKKRKGKEKRKMKGLNGKKGLILVALMIALMLGTYASQYYEWTVSYTVNPLTSDITISIPDTSGATTGSYEDTHAGLVTTTKAVTMYFMIIDLPDDYKWEADVWASGANGYADVEDVYYSLSVTIKLVDATDATEYGEATLTIVTGGSAEGTPIYGGISVPADKTCDATITVSYTTGAIPGAAASSFVINVFAEE